MTGYVNVFGGSSVQPALPAYRAVALTADVTLVWPPQSTTPTDYVARIMEVTATGAFAITMPDATAVSPGFDVIFTNPGANTYTVKGNDGSTLFTVAPGAVQYAYLKDTSTAAGTWGVFQFASLSSAVAAASLAGPGVSASGASLYASEVTQTFSSPYTALAADRTKCFVWTGGVGTLTLSAAGTVGNDWFIGVANQGTGILTIARTGADTIDGATSITLQAGESCDLHSAGGTAYFTVGRGRSTQFNFTLLTKAVTGGTVTLTNTEAANVVQKYTGVLISNLTVVLPSTVQVYYVSNVTTGAFSTTFKTAGVGTTVTVPQGQNAILFCDGVNVVNASTTVSGISSLSLLAGAVGSPSLSFVSDGTTGIYQSTSGRVSFTCTGSQAGEFSSTGLFVNNAVNIATAGGDVTTANYGGLSNNKLAVLTGSIDEVAFGGILPAIGQRYARGAIGAPTSVQDTDRLAGWFGGGYHSALGPGWANPTMITAEVDGSTAGVTTAIPGRIVFYTQAINGTRLERGRISSTGAWSLSAANSGRTLTVNAVSGAAAGVIASVAGQSSYLVYSINSVDTGFIGVIGASTQIINDSTANDIFVRVDNHSFRVSTNAGASSALVINSAGNAVIAAPSSGAALKVSSAGAGGGAVLDLFTSNEAGGNNIQVTNANASAVQWFVAFSSADINFGNARSGALNIYSNSLPRVLVGSGGNITVNTPSSGNTLTVNAISGQNSWVSQDGTCTFLIQHNGAGGAFIGTNSAHTTNIGAGGSTKLAIPSSGQANFNIGVYTPTSSQAFTATPTFNAALSNVFEFSGAMTGNVTSCTISNPANGQTINIRVKQDGSGSHTFAAPSGAKISGSINPTASAASILTLTYSAMDSRWEGSWLQLPP